MTLELDEILLGLVLNTARFRDEWSAAKESMEARKLGRMVIENGGKLTPDETRLHAVSCGLSHTCISDAGPPAISGHTPPAPTIDDVDGVGGSKYSGGADGDAHASQSTRAADNSSVYVPARSGTGPQGP